MQSYYKFINFSAIGLFLLLVTVTLFISQRKISSKAIDLSTDKIKFTGKIIEDKDISAIGLVGKYIVIGADEGNTIQLLEPNDKKSKYRVAENIELPVVKTSKAEIDIEGIAVAKDIVYVVGSHSFNKAVKVEDENNRQNVFRFQLNSHTGKLESSIQKESLRGILEQDERLSQFANVQHQKNGVDIEGVAVKNEQLYFGFRTPVIQNDYVPVIVVKFEHLDHNDKYELRYVNLGGNGIRDLVSVNEGFLILADTTGVGGDNYQIYFWNGDDGLSKLNTAPGIKFLSEIPSKKNTRAEGLTVLTETDANYQVLVVYDGIAKGNPTIFDIQK